MVSNASEEVYCQFVLLRVVTRGARCQLEDETLSLEDSTIVTMARKASAKLLTPYGIVA